jgi:hypothetical protein
MSLWGTFHIQTITMRMLSKGLFKKGGLGGRKKEERNLGSTTQACPFHLLARTRH